MGGSSLPENVFDVYNPIIDYLKDYTKEPERKTVFEFFFDYLNTASSHMLMRIMNLVSKIKYKCPDTQINWCYESGDLDIKELGEELADEVDVDFNLIEKSELKYTY